MQLHSQDPQAGLAQHVLTLVSCGRSRLPLQDSLDGLGLFGVFQCGLEIRDLVSGYKLLEWIQSLAMLVNEIKGHLEWEKDEC